MLLQFFVPSLLVSHHLALLFSCSCLSFSLLLCKINSQCLMLQPPYFSFSISLIFSPVPHLSSSLPLSVPSPPLLLLNTDQPSCLHLLTRPPLLSPLPPQTQCRTSAHILPFLHFFCLEGAGGRPVIRISFLCSFTHSFHSSHRTLSLWHFYLPLLKGCPFLDEGPV